MELDQAIRTAIEYEAGVHRTYQEAMQRTTDAKGKRFFEVLRDEEMVRTLDGDGRRLFERFGEIEEGHQAIVQAEIDSVSGTGVWFDTKEFNLEMG